MNELPMVVVKNNGHRPELQFNQNCKWSIYTVTGQLVHESLDELEVGVYVLHCFDSNRDQVFKLMVGEN